MGSHGEGETVGGFVLVCAATDGITDSSQAEMAAKQRPTTSVREQQPPSLDDDDDEDGSRTQAAGEFFDD